LVRASDKGSYQDLTDRDEVLEKHKFWDRSSVVRAIDSSAPDFLVQVSYIMSVAHKGGQDDNYKKGD